MSWYEVATTTVCLLLGGWCLGAGGVRRGTNLVKPSQQDGADHAGGVDAQARQEAGTLQSHVRRSDDECLSGRVLHEEQVIAGDPVLLGPGNVWIAGTATCDTTGTRRKNERHSELETQPQARLRPALTDSNDNAGCCHHAFLSTLVGVLGGEESHTK